MPHWRRHHLREKSGKKIGGKESKKCIGYNFAATVKLERLKREYSTSKTHEYACLSGKPWVRLLAYWKRVFWGIEPSLSFTDRVG